MIFFADRDLGALFPRILSDAGLLVVKHDDEFADERTPDEVWLQRVGANGWFAISRDKRIRFRPNERQAVIREGVGLFLVMGNARHEELALNFVDCIGKIERFCDRHKPPFIAGVYRPTPLQRAKQRRPRGRVELLFPKERL